MRSQIMKKGGLQHLQQLLFCPSIDPLFIAIDFERPRSIANNFNLGSNTQAGISIFDTQDLSTPRTRILELETYNFIKVSLGDARKDTLEQDARMHQ